MKKERELEDLKKQIAADKKLRLKSNLVFGEGNANAQVVFIGEAPGAKEDIEGRPFVGRSGQLLRRMICENGWKESEVYITNIVKQRPPENRDPTQEEILLYIPYLQKQLDIIKPKIIVPLGRFSTNYFLPKAKITIDQGKVFLQNKRKIFPMLHPAAALRSTKRMKMFIDSFKTLSDITSGVYKGRVIKVD